MDASETLMRFWLPYASFGVVMSITPGPNNLMLLASGARHGFRRTLPHMLGISVGCAVMLVLFEAGIAQLLARLPWLTAGLRWLGIAYLVWLAWKLLGAGAPGEGKAGKPLGWIDAAVFQWLNPKAWMMAFTAVSTFIAPSIGGSATGLIMAVLVFNCINLVCIAVWAGFGAGLREWLVDPHRRQVFNIAMAGLTALTAIEMAL